MTSRIGQNLPPSTWPLRLVTLVVFGLVLLLARTACAQDTATMLARICWSEDGVRGDECAALHRSLQNKADYRHDWILIDAGITKAGCLERVSAAGIALPVMYGLGFDHNNCIGCVKATSPGYWNRTRRLFPEVFARRARQSRALGVRLARVKGERVYLDMLPPEADAPDDSIECGPVCQGSAP